MRARNLKPSIFKNDQLAVADPLYTLIFEGLWCLADREGRLEDRPSKIHLEINPGRAFEGTQLALEWLNTHEFIQRYEVNGQYFIQVVKFALHQNPHFKEAVSKIPGKPEASPRKARGKPSASTRLAPGKPEASPADSLFSDSGLLIPDSGSLNPESLLVPSEPMSSAEPPDPVWQVFDHWRLTWNHPRAALDPKRTSIIKRALKGYSVADLCTAISGYQHSPHHTGQNDRQTVYDALELFLRDSAHIDAGLRFAQNPQALTSGLATHNVRVLTDWTHSERGDERARPAEISDGDGESGGGLLKAALAAAH